jgi:1-acyl-sn-glycerol-3-phosphate acyltransferase
MRPATLHPLHAAAWLAALPLLLLAALLLDAVALPLLLLGGLRTYGRTVAAGVRVLMCIAGRLTGSTVRIEHAAPAQALPEGPCIFVANHQPPLDFLLLAMACIDRMPAFVARAGLGAHVPVAGLYLWATGSLARRGDPASGPLACDIRLLARRAAARGGSVAIFPEGRTAWGEEARQRPFNRSGLRRLMRLMPHAPLVPVVFEGGDRLFGGSRWLPRCGQQLRMRMLGPLHRGEAGIDELITACEQAVHREQALQLARRAGARGDASRPLPEGAATASADDGA